MFVTLAMALVAVALILTACGDDDQEATTNPAPSAAPPGGSADSPSLSAFPPGFVECMADQGIDLESVPDISAAVHSPEGDRCFDELHGG